MKSIKQILLGVVVGLVIGLWFGVNIGKQQPILSNPFAEQTIEQRLKASGDRLLEKGGEVLEQSGRALKEKVQK